MKRLLSTLYMIVLLIGFIIGLAALLLPNMTRRDLTVMALVGLQENDGSFEHCQVRTAEALTIAAQLDMLEMIDVGKAIDDILNHTHIELHTLYKVSRALESVNALDRLNRSMVKEFILERYDESSGGFHELLIEVNGTLRTIVDFPIQFRSTPEAQKIAWAIPNTISTFLALEIADVVNITDSLDQQKIMEFVEQCYNDEVGAFQPFPGTVKSNDPFDVDVYGCGLPYTYAGIRAKKILDNDIKEPTKIRDYILQCCTSNPEYKVTYFLIHPDGLAGKKNEAFNYFAVKSMEDIKMLNDEVKPIIDNIKNTILNDQEVDGGDIGLWRGFYSMEIISGTYYYVNTAQLLDKSTLNKRVEWYSLQKLQWVGLSAIIVFISSPIILYLDITYHDDKR